MSNTKPVYQVITNEENQFITVIDTSTKQVLYRVSNFENPNAAKSANAIAFLMNKAYSNGFDDGELVGWWQRKESKKDEIYSKNESDYLLDEEEVEDENISEYERQQILLALGKDSF